MQRNNREIVADEQSPSSIQEHGIGFGASIRSLLPLTSAPTSTNLEMSPSTSSSGDHERLELMKEQVNLVSILMRRECGTGINKERAISPGMHTDKDRVTVSLGRGTPFPSSILINRPVQGTGVSLLSNKVKKICFFQQIRGCDYGCERCYVAFTSREVFLEHFSGHMVAPSTELKFVRKPQNCPMIVVAAGQHKCEMCGKEFPFKIELAGHKMKHSITT